MSTPSVVPFVVGFYSIKSRGNLQSNYRELATFLTENKFKCVSFTEYPISQATLSKIDILVIPCPDNMKFLPAEIESIKEWVLKLGGGLLMLNHAGGDKGRRTNLTELSEQFGMIFESNQVLDKSKNLGVENLPIIDKFTIPHPILDDVSEICFRAGCSLTISGTNTSPVVVSGENADPFESPLILAAEYDHGRIVGCGSYEMFRDKITGGFKHKAHSKLAFNIFQWLKTTYREQFKISQQLQTTQSSDIFTNQPQEGTEFDQGVGLVNNNEQGEIAVKQGSIHPEMVPMSKTYETNVKIVTSADLFKAFEDAITEMYSFKERMLIEFDILQKNLSHLIQSVIASKDDVIQVQQKWTQGEVDLVPSNVPQEEMPVEEEVLQLRNQDQVEPQETSLPPVSASFALSETQPGEASIEGDMEESTELPVKVPSPQTMTKDSLKSELDGLENKLNSIRNLMTFVEKKFASGNLSKINYEKQIKKLESDSKRTRYRIDEIRAQLEKL